MNKPKLFLLFLGDVIALYAGLFITLLVRYNYQFYKEFVDYHFLPFSIIFVFWIVIFFVAGLYEPPRLRNNIDFPKTLFSAIGVSAVLSFLFFYLIPGFGITPKTNLLIFIIVYSLLSLGWRRYFNKLVAPYSFKSRLLVIGSGKAAEEIRVAVRENPQLGYVLALDLPEEPSERTTRPLAAAATSKAIDEIVVPWTLKHRERFGRFLYGLLYQNVRVHDTPSFYEIIFRKIPINDVEETWLLEHISAHPRFYDNLKRAVEFICALAVGVILLPLEIVIALLILLTSRGPAVYQQTRVGRSQKTFTLYKFRTMHINAEKNGAQWAAPGDNRTTAIGKLLRYTHLDELPQLLNILKGNLSFVGPRPERPEFVNILKEKIPYYAMRHLVKPGITGWAQTNYHYTASIEDSREKLEYDLYYIKNRSIVLDIMIILKTLKALFINEKWIANELS